MFENLFKNENTLYSMRPFKYTATHTAALGSTATLLVDDLNLGEKIYLQGFILKVDGATAWTDAAGTIVKLQDGAGVVGITIPKALLTGNAVVQMSTASVVIGDAVSEGTGFTLEENLYIVADDIFTAGSDLKITAFGFVGM
jgi:hypothetical protein